MQAVSGLHILLVTIRGERVAGHVHVVLLIFVWKLVACPFLSRDS